MDNTICLLDKCTKENQLENFNTLMMSHTYHLSYNLVCNHKKLYQPPPTPPPFPFSPVSPHRRGALKRMVAARWKITDTFSMTIASSSSLRPNFGAVMSPSNATT